LVVRRLGRRWLMGGRDPRRLKIPALLYVGAVLGGGLGACIGYAL
jgi:hypothetical protein